MKMKYVKPVTEVITVEDFNFVFDENNTGITDISDIKPYADLAVTAADGAITVYAKTGQRVEIFNMDGLSVATLNVDAGEARSVPVVSGIYVVNNLKISVK